MQEKMKVLKKILTLGLLLTSVVSQAEMFSEEEYQKIEDSFKLKQSI